MPQQGENGCARLTDGRYLHHPAGVSFRLLPCGRRSTRNRCSSLLRFEADENISPSGAECAIYANSYNNDISFKFGRITHITWVLCVCPCRANAPARFSGIRLLSCERRSTRNRCSSLLRFEADENISPSGAECAIYANSYNNDISFKFGRKRSS